MIDRIASCLIVALSRFTSNSEREVNAMGILALVGLISGLMGAYSFLQSVIEPAASRADVEAVSRQVDELGEQLSRLLGGKRPATTVGGETSLGGRFHGRNERISDDLRNSTWILRVKSGGHFDPRRFRSQK
ncbi:hypothetical protein ACH0BU_17765 [Sphingomonas olei]